MQLLASNGDHVVCVSINHINNDLVKKQVPTLITATDDLHRILACSDPTSN